jgi:hypothetical protein
MNFHTIILWLGKTQEAEFSILSDAFIYPIREIFLMQMTKH